MIKNPHFVKLVLFCFLKLKSEMIKFTAFFKSLDTGQHYQTNSGNFIEMTKSNPAECCRCCSPPAVSFSPPPSELTRPTGEGASPAVTVTLTLTLTLTPRTPGTDPETNRTTETPTRLTKLTPQKLRHHYRCAYNLHTPSWRSFLSRTFFLTTARPRPPTR